MPKVKIMDNQFILEAKYLDKINRVKRKTIIGVFKDLNSMEKVKEQLIQDETQYKVTFSIKSQFHPFLNPIVYTT
jgi:hypothetical protein